MPTLARNVLAFAAWLLVAGSLFQVFLAGLGVFNSPTDFETHRNFGYILGFLALGLLILAAVLRIPRVPLTLIVLVFLAFIAQSLLVGVRTSAPYLAALHPLNGFAIVLLSIWFARSAWRLAGRTAL